MADTVVIVGLRRGGSLIRASELRQMMGRAGREHDEEAVVQLVVDGSDEGVADEMLSEGATTVSSSLSDPDMLAMALMPEIHRGKVTDMESVAAWCSRSFCPNPSAEKAVELLREVEAVTMEGGRLKATEIGSCAARFYFHPADVFAWWRNFSEVFNMGLEDNELAPAWALGNVPFERVVGDLGDRRQIASDCASRLPLGLDAMKGSLINVVSWWYLIGGPSPGSIRPACLERRKGFGRYKAALEALNRAAKWGMSDFFEELELRVRKGLVPDLVPLCRFSGITKARGKYLHELGARGPDDFSRMIGKLDEDIEDDFKEVLERIARSRGAARG